MARTRAEVRAFLDRQVGTVVPHPGYYDLRGQCVTLTKALMEFLGCPNPYAARGNAITAGDAYIAQGLGKPGRGWLTICVNRDMGYIGGVHYGHIWVDLLNEANYESNGARALYTTKNTRPVTQAQQFVNFDQWIVEERSDKMIIQNAENWYGRCNKTMILIRGRELGCEEFTKHAVGAEFLHWVEAVSDHPEADAALGWQNVGRVAVTDNWQKQIEDLQAALKGRPSVQELADAKKQATDLASQIQSATDRAKAAEEKAAALEVEHIEAEKAGNAFTLWLGGILSKLTGGK